MPENCQGTSLLYAMTDSNSLELNSENATAQDTLSVRQIVLVVQSNNAFVEECKDWDTEEGQYLN